MISLSFRFFFLFSLLVFLFAARLHFAFVAIDEDDYKSS